MLHFVVKKDGTKVSFDSGKIKSTVMAACSEAGLSIDETAKITDDVFNSVMMSFEGEEDVPTTEIREKILLELDVVAPAVSESWRNYDQSKGE